MLRLSLALVAAVGAGAMNAIAGGGTLLTFPAIVALGVAPLVANATSSTRIASSVRPSHSAIGASRT